MTYTLQDIAKHIGAELAGDGSTVIAGIAPLQQAEPNTISFLDNPLYQKHLPDTQAAAVILTPAMAEHCQKAKLIVSQPYVAFAKAAQLFDTTPIPNAAIAPTAVIDPAAKIGKDVAIGPHCVVEAGAVIEDNVILGAGCFVGANSCIGSGTRLWPQVVVYHDVTIGERCVLHSHAVIGSDGFGFAKDKGQWVKVPQVGGVTVGSDVEIGAATTIDRGALKDTLIADGVKLDNHIQIGHNVKIGEHTAIAGLSGIAGSTTIGKHCVIGGGTGINGHIEVTDNVYFTGNSMVTRSVNKPGLYSSGTGLQTNQEWHKTVVRLRQLDGMARRLKSVEKQLESSDED